MNERFRNIVDSLETKLRALLDCAPAKPKLLPKSMPRKGIYLISEGTTHLYVGRSNNIRNRIANHTRLSGSSYQATLAFTMAREKTGIKKATYTTAGSRQELEQSPVFRDAFSNAKERLAKADIRYVEETDSTTQALLEIYVATSLDTPFNDFDNH